MSFESVMEIIRWPLLIATIIIGLSSICMILSTFGPDPRDIFFNLLERKKTGKHPFPSEKESRKRVQEALANASMSVKEKCLFLDDELGRVMDSIFISREWKDEISDMAGDLMKQTGLTMADFF